MQKRKIFYVYFAVVVNMLRNSRIGMHCMNGSPVKPSWQTQLAVWSRQVHLAPSPQMCPSAHGSTQCWFRQTMCGAQSLLRVHSGWQPVCGSPAMSGKHEHAALPPITSQSVFGPQGLGMHGFPMGKRSETDTQLKILSTKRYFRFIKYFLAENDFLFLQQTGVNTTVMYCFIIQNKVLRDGFTSLPLIMEPDQKDWRDQESSEVISPHRLWPNLHPWAENILFDHVPKLGSKRTIFDVSYN